MRVLIDPQIFSIQYCGMLKYYTALYYGLKKEGLDVVSPITYSQSEYFPKKKLQLLSKNGFLTRASTYYLSKRCIKKYHKSISKGNFDILYITAPSFETGFLNHLNGKPFVMTVHDTMMSISGNNTFYDLSGQEPGNMGYLANLAKKVITVSDHTRKDLCDFYKVDSSKTVTIYPANIMTTETAEIHGIPDKYVLFVGSRRGRKNFFGWLKAVASYLESRPDLKVVVTGPLTQTETFFLEKMNCFQNIVSKENVSDAQLNTLYRNALCLVYPSLYEGFGLPVIEAMANGCPVITTRLSSIPEVAGNAALYVNPFDDRDMLNTLAKIHQDIKLRQILRDKSLKQSRKFSHDRFIKQTIQVLESAIV